ncbi:hypothetical protein NVS47_00765 [Dehalobacterium formicoaceticum]|uniref:Membrane protein YkvI n=1 Tax=Dehalobacterium formicoaceticum TaxID=51515 RepID=A0ABT1XZL9_9FIRM|nr:hypothetical protein [Dehalobacterium formicoaceticum]MCR6544064.1 hypothetical protein [Dehalobacterium formicoaceticum]
MNFGQVIIYAGAFIAFLIGSGFATGQEIMQYFVSYGYMGILGAFIVLVLFLYVGVSFVSAGYNNKFVKRNDVYKYYCGKYIGAFYDYFSVLFIYMSFIVMIGGAGATLHQQYGLPTYIGGIGMAILAGGTVVFGLNKIVDVIGKIGPVIAIMAILLGLAGIMMNPRGLATANEIIPKLNLLQASTNWLFAAGSYVGFCMLWLATFMSSIGAEAKNKKEAVWGTIFGAIGFSTAVIVVALGFMANIEDVAGSLVPSLILAGKIHPTLAIVFSLTVVAGIYTTAVPLLWTVVARISEEKTSTFKLITLVLAAIGTFVGLMIPFDRLVNIIYVINGYVGILLLALMLFKDLRSRKEIKES